MVFRIQYRRPNHHSPPTASEIRQVARVTVDIFASHNIPCCLFGGAACALYGTTRTPGDVDLVVFTKSHTQEELKRLLESKNSSFYTVAAKTPGATYRVLWYRIPGTTTFGGLPKLCKVDILVPPTLNIPWVPPERIERIDGIPVMPILPLLLLKLQGWEDHTEAHQTHLRLKQTDDVRDIKELRRIAARRGIDLQTTKPESWMSSALLDQARVRLGKVEAAETALDSLSSIFNNSLTF
ncbi:hypothetical protein PUNSTDRAFT_68008 [Punctularia strigosozonata HHB-11173 SS5]|uniref:uncharacterized protein n=1 Tax=Punctularia strigosozonata (strain HHB-11173) TaxID=741275 RepID=UPI0004417426|nr:uncharacterized protein PUNSTDRAFT_68008 [Punctularia strigosozonata HHB-11173 SS5]EIN09003.1 hypothetical protein PUNSTDRAFT_68008 [Punctularia strigosozonata HHB-11173 SS5]